MPQVLHMVHSLEGGGTERTLLALLRAMDASVGGHDVVTLREAGPLAAELPDHVACFPLQIPGRCRLAGIGVARVARDRGSKILHARNTGCWADAMLAKLLVPRLRLLLGFHGCETDGPSMGRLRRRVRWGARLGAAFATVSDSGRDEISATGVVPTARVHVVRNGVDLRRFQPVKPAVRAQARTALGFSSQHFVIGTVGSLSPVKRHDVLVRAFAAAANDSPSIRLLVVGSGPLADELVSLTGSLGVADRVVFAGSRQDVPELLAAMDLYTCATDYESMSNALLEAMASQLPIVASDAPGNLELISEGVNGMVVPRGSVPDMARAIRRLVADSDLRQRLGCAARVNAERFGFDRTVTAYQTLYAALGHAPSRRRACLHARTRGATGSV